jgi:hypothetical protein
VTDSRPSPALPLRVALWITFAAGILALGDAAWLMLTDRPSPEPIPDLPDLSAFEVIGMLAVGAVCIAVSTLGLLARRRRSPVLAFVYFALAGGLFVHVVVLLLGDSGGDASIVSLLVLLAGWWALLILLGTTSDALAQLSLSDRWRWRVRGTLVLIVTGLVAFLLVSDWQSPAARRAVALLRPGQSWREVVLATQSTCAIGRGDIPAGVMSLDCPAATPLVTTSIELRFENDRLATWSRRPFLRGPH